jgi:DNA-binding response OmpR family regulator
MTEFARAETALAGLRCDWNGAEGFHPMKTRILIVDDDPMTIELLRAYLEKEAWQVIVADNGRDALNLAREAKPDLVVLDLMLPRVDGLDVCRILRATSNVPIVMLTARSTEEDVLLGLDLGADDYIAKPFSPRQLVARIRAVLRRKGSSNRDQPEVIRHGELMVSLNQHEVRIGAEIIALTPREFKLLVIMAREPGRVFSRIQLLEGAFGPETESLERTVDYHIMNLRRKLDAVSTTTEFIQTVFGVGYRFTPHVPAA